MFADIVHLQTLFGAGGLGMGVSAVADCAAKYTRTEGGVVVCADGNATDNWSTPPDDGWGYYGNEFGEPVKCIPGAFCGRDGNF
mmetsp:Transcript_68464/g.157314  ORF Transcript_68464/g.157314 Transcript_68464/m.157314 type:complete len:84 (+) Transcript_68464:3-254(+)